MIKVLPQLNIDGRIHVAAYLFLFGYAIRISKEVVIDVR